MAEHHRELNDWLERSAQVIKDWEDWKDSQDPRDLGLPRDVRTSGPADSDIVNHECHR